MASSTWVFLVLVVGSMPLLGQPGQSHRVLSVCDVLAELPKYNGKMIAVRGILGDTDEGVWLEGRDCRKPVRSGNYVWKNLIWIASPSDRGVLPPITFQQDEEAIKEAREQVSQKRKDRDKQEAWVTFEGVLQTWANIDSAVYVGGSGSIRPAGFGHLGVAPAQLVMKTAYNVAVKAIQRKR